VGGIVLAALILSSALWIYRESKTAGAFLQDAAGLRVGITTSAELRLLASRYGGRLGTTSCSPSGTAFFFIYDNGWLYRVHLAPYTRLACTLGDCGGFFCYRRLALETAGVGMILVEEQKEAPTGVSGPFRILRRGAGDGEPWQIRIWMTPAASSAQRYSALHLNAHCLSKLGGCADVGQMLTGKIWDSRAAAGDIRSTRRDVHDK
jgi:hypothetical protein